jgi:hypothetical protein
LSTAIRAAWVFLGLDQAGAHEEDAVLFVGVDWAEAHHDVCVLAEDGRVLARGQVSDDLAGIGRLHALVGEHAILALVGRRTALGRMRRLCRAAESKTPKQPLEALECPYAWLSLGARPGVGGPARPTTAPQAGLLHQDSR